ncbi:hypothetical protein ACHQM5_018655 [Ranunculus cassubicifolius]
MFAESFSWLMEKITDDYASRATLTLYSLLILTSLYAFSVILKSKKSKAPLLPPGPRGLPLVGNLLFLKPNLHQFLAKLAITYGPVLKIQLGRQLCIVLSSSSVAKEVFTEHDVTFANHDPSAMGLALGFSMVWTPYGATWRMLRKLSFTHIFRNKRLDSTYGIRQREAQQVVQSIKFLIGKPILIKDYISSSIFNILSNSIWGASLVGEEKKQIYSETRKITQDIFHLLGNPNISDFFPVLSIFDLQRKQPKMKKLISRFDEIFDRVFQHSLRAATTETTDTDFLQTCLQVIKDGDKIDIAHIKSITLDMLLAGSDSLSNAIEWAFTEVMRRPDIMNKVQEEINQVVGVNNPVEEAHLLHLPYLNAVLKESLRLHPPGPFLVPRCPSESCVVGGYLVPKGTKILINVWAIQRDPAFWEKPLEFCPERFLGSSCDKFDFKGSDFNYIPFAAGRRVCPAYPLAERMLPHLLATLLHSFAWSLPNAEKVDMSETFTLELKKKIPLMVFPTAR